MPVVFVLGRLGREHYSNGYLEDSWADEVVKLLSGDGPFCDRVRRGPRGFALKFKNRESYTEDRTHAQNPGLRLSLLLSVSFALLRAPIWEPFWFPMGP